MLRSYSPQSTPESVTSRWHWLEMVGPDAPDYLHRITTVDINGLEVGRGAPGCLLTAQGKLRAWFWVWRLENDRFGFELDSGPNGKWLPLFLESMEQLHFAEKFTLTEYPGLTLRWLFPDSPFAGSSANQGTKIGGARFLNHGARDFGHDWISVWGEAASLPPSEAVTASQLEEWRIDALRPRAGAEVDENTIPLEVGLVDALATNKGCYPGQEVIERTISLGSPARRLARLTLEGPANTGDSLLLIGPTGEAGPEIGKLSSVASGRALALVRKTHAKEGMELVIGTPTQAAHGPAQGMVRARIVALAPFK